MDQNSAKTRLSRRRKLTENSLIFRWLNLALAAIFGTGISWGFFNIPLECPKIYLALDYQPETVEVDFQFRLTLKEARYCQVTQEKNKQVEE